MAFESILNLSESGKGYLISSSNAYFNFDSVTVQQHTSKLKLTDNPVESGATITDHAVLEPKELTINGIMVGYTPPNSTITNKMKSYSLVDYSLPIEVKTMTEKAENLVNQITLAYRTVNHQDTLIAADFLPANDMVSYDLSSTDRIVKAHEMLLNLQRSGEFLTFQTNLKLYTNMMIISVSASQQTAMSCEFSIVMREVFIVNSQKASGLKLNLGITQPVSVDSSSMLKYYVG